MITVARGISGRIFQGLINKSISLRPSSNLVENFEQNQEEEDDVLYRKLDVEVRGHDKVVLDSYETFLKTTCQHLGLEIDDSWSTTRPLKRRWTVLRSVHIYKKHRTQYETRTHIRGWSIPRLTGSTADTFLEYVQRNLPEGCAMKVDRHQLMPLPQTIQP